MLWGGEGGCCGCWLGTGGVNYCTGGSCRACVQGAAGARGCWVEAVRKAEALQLPGRAANRLYAPLHGALPGTTHIQAKSLDFMHGANWG